MTTRLVAQAGVPQVSSDRFRMRHHRSTISRPVFTVLAGMFLAVTAVGGPLWTHRPASDIKWYKVTDIGAVPVAEKAVSTAETV